MKPLAKLFVIGFFTLMITVGCLEIAYSHDNHHGIENYLDHFHRLVRPHYAARAKRMIPSLVKYADKHGVDPLVIACLWSFESSWRNFHGALGEQGPGQVMPGGPAAKRFNLSTLDGQIEASVWVYKQGAQRCGSMRGALTYYACGSCHSKSQRTQSKILYRLSYIRRMQSRFGG